MTCKTSLYDYQQRGADKLGGSRVGSLYMDMGTGKTRTAIELAARRWDRLSKVVYFCPVSLKETVRQELLKHVVAPRICVFDDSTATDALPEADWYICGTESVSQSDRVTLALNALIDENTFVIVDESGLIKNHRAKRTQRLTMLSGRARWRLILTGTPISQGIADLYAQMKFLSWRILGYRSFYKFEANHLEYHPDYPGLVVRTHNKEYLAAKMQPYVYQVTKDEALDLPAKIHETRYFSRSREQAALYDQAKQEMLMQLAPESIGSYEIFRLFTALQQITCGFWNRREIPEKYVDDWGQISIPRSKLSDLPVRHERARHGRVRLLLKVVDEITDRHGAEEKVLIWTRYHYCLRQIMCALGTTHGPESFAELHGGLKEEERAEEIQRWRENERCRFLVATPETGAHGFTLTEACYAIFYNDSFNFATHLQAEDRIHRLSQDRRPTYISLVCSDSVDERIAESLAKKESVLKAFRQRVDKVKEESTGAMEELARTL